MHVAWGVSPSKASSLPKERRAILYIVAAALDHPGLFLRDGVGEGRAVEYDLPGVTRAVVNPDLDMVGRRREWLRIADERQTAVVACEQFAGQEVFQAVPPVANVIRQRHVRHPFQENAVKRCGKRADRSDDCLSQRDKRC
jgi:hypothetical protein